MTGLFDDLPAAPNGSSTGLFDDLPAAQSVGPAQAANAAEVRSVTPEQAAQNARVGSGTVADPVSRTLAGMIEPIAGANQLAARGYNWLTNNSAPNWQKGADELVNAAESQGRHAKELAGLAPSDIDWYGTAGNIASPVNYIVPEAGPAAGVLGRVGMRTLQGATIGATAPVENAGNDYWEKKGGQAATGAIVNNAVTPIAKAAGAVISPVYNDAVNKLMDAGIRLTPGQMAGGLAKRIEDNLQSYPFVGQMIRDARERSINDFQIAAANEALAPIGKKVGTSVNPGPDLIQNVEDQIGAEYNRIHPNVSLSLDQGLVGDVASIMQQARTRLPDQEYNQLSAIIADQVNGKISRAGGATPGNVVQSMTSELSNEIKGYRRDQSYDKRKLSGYLSDTRQAIRDALARQNPSQAPDLLKANEAWMMYAKLRDAAGRSGRTGEFSPTQLELAAKRGETAGTKAKGTAPLQEIAAAAKEIIPTKVPDSGTPERAALMNVISGIGSHGLAYGVLGPHVFAPAAGIALAYNPAGQAVIRKAMTVRPPGADMVADIVRKYAPAVSTRLSEF